MGRSVYRAGFVGGMIGAVAMTVSTALALRMRSYPHWSSTSFETLLGSFLLKERSSAAWMIGLGWHVINGGVFALAYAAIFKLVRHASPLLGAAIGVLHWVMAGFLVNLLSVMHPLAPVRVPVSWAGFLWGALALHIIYGAVVGVFCRSQWHRRRTSVTMEEAREARRVA